jgi:hypothetical protein
MIKIIKELIFCISITEGTKIPYDIGTWLPIYTKISVSNAKLVSKALFLRFV